MTATGAVLDSESIQALIRRNYSLVPVDIECLASGASRALYRIEDGDGNVWMLRLRHQEQPASDWLDGGDVVDWLRERAGLLEWLEQRRYPAPRLQRNKDQMPVSEYQSWCGILVSYIPGERLTVSSESSRALAALLGRLHAVEVPAGANQPAAHSWWHPLDRAAEYALRQLATRSPLPPEWETLRATCQAILEDFVAPPDLPLACIHADGWPGNTIRDPEGQVRLIDWDVAGLGHPILDFGAVLSDCFAYPSESPAVDAAWVESAVDAYVQHRPITNSELGLLLKAIQFGAAYRTAIRFTQAQQAEWPDYMIRGLTHERMRLSLSGEIAKIAAARIRA